MAFPGGSDGEESACSGGDQVQSLSHEDSPEKGMATHSNILAWRIPWTEESGESMGLQRIRHDWVTNTSQIYTYWTKIKKKKTIIYAKLWSNYLHRCIIQKKKKKVS